MPGHGFAGRSPARMKKSLKHGAPANIIRKKCDRKRGIILTAYGIPPADKNIVLTGFMGAGKTKVGQILARRLGRELVDTDEEIERRQGMTIQEIFRKMGEAAFRQIERECVTELCAKARRKVISLGGGAFMQEEIRKVCLDMAYVVFLDLAWEEWQNRIPLIRDTRPLLQTKTLDEIRQLFDTRRKIYALSHFIIPAADPDAEAIADRIIGSIAEKHPEFAT